MVAALNGQAFPAGKGNKLGYGRISQVAFAFAFVGVGMLTMWASESVRDGVALPGTIAAYRQQRCSYTFSSYVPSQWEQEWLNAGASRHESICSTMHSEISLSETWMTITNESFNVTDVATTLQATSGAGSKVFSHFEYSNSCGGEPLRVPIEPLVGLLRHPLVMRGCNPEGHSLMAEVRHDEPNRPDYHIQNKGYMLINPIERATWAQMYPGRAILLDIGTGRYRSGSLPWFTEFYRQRGVEFDDIFGWEVKPSSGPEYWGEVPVEMRARMHYFNVPCDTGSDSPFNPLNIVKNMYQPGDFIVIKLDIDNEPIEQAMMKQLRENEGIVDMVAEMYFEQHFNATEMRWSFGTGLKTQLADVQQHFFDFRTRGLRLHYWP